MDWFSYFVLACVMASTAKTAYRTVKDPSDLKGIFNAWRPRYLLYSVAILAAVGTTATLLLHYGGPVLNWGWWSALGGVGNIAFGQVSHDGGFVATALSLVVPLLLVVAIPYLALWEERTFRKGIELSSPLGKLRKALTFGLVHMFAGIPLGVALALTIGGLYFTRVYSAAYHEALKAAPALVADGRLPRTNVKRLAQEVGVYTAAAAHATYNYIVLTLVLGYVITDLLA